MSTDSEDLDMFGPRPFWFVPEELLVEMWHAEINTVIQLFAMHPGIRQLLDAADTTVPQRKVCFELLGHRKLIEIIDETALGRYVDLPALSEAESVAIRESHGLVTSDAPRWVLEIDDVADSLPAYLNRALPEPLREQGFHRNDPAKDEAVRSAAGSLNTLEQIQALTARVIDEQLKRLGKRWLATIGQTGGPKKPKHWLKGDKGLVRKADLSQYMNGLTEKQQLAASLKWEYQLGLSEIASRMGIIRKTAQEHIDAAKKKMNEAMSSIKRSASRAKNTPN